MNPHINANCELREENNELKCNNTHRLQDPTLVSEGMIEFECPANTHRTHFTELSDETLVVVTRRTFEYRENTTEELRNALLTELQSRDVRVPDSVTDIDWYVINLTEKEVNKLETTGMYPEAYEMSRVPEGERDNSGMWQASRNDLPRVMLISNWGLQDIPDECGENATLIQNTDYEKQDF